MVRLLVAMNYSSDWRRNINKVILRTTKQWVMLYCNRVTVFFFISFILWTTSPKGANACWAILGQNHRPPPKKLIDRVHYCFRLPSDNVQGPSFIQNEKKTDSYTILFVEDHQNPMHPTDSPFFLRILNWVCTTTLYPNYYTWYDIFIGLHMSIDVSVQCTT